MTEAGGAISSLLSEGLALRENPVYHELTLAWVELAELKVQLERERSHARFAAARAEASCKEMRRQVRKARAGRRAAIARAAQALDRCEEQAREEFVA